MNTDDPAMLDKHIESTLAQLPEWQVPDDFSRRLAAAAARQAATPAVAPPRPAWGEMVPVTLWSAGLAAVLGWVIPWSELSGTSLVWTCVAAMSAAGAFLTLRVLRSH